MTIVFPGQIDRMDDFLKKEIIAVHWGIGDLTGCTTKEQVAKVVAKANLQPTECQFENGIVISFYKQNGYGGLLYSSL